MQLFYSFLYTLAFFGLLPYFAYQAIFNRKYLGNLRGRLWLKLDGQNDPHPAIWLHAVSVGETMAAKPLITALRKQFPNHRLVVSTTTMTGQEVARNRLTDVEMVCYFPFDWKFSVRRALNAIQPEIVILMESELWLNFLHECSARKIPVVVVNGRISDRSFPRSQKFIFFVRRLYGLVTLFLMQSRLDAERALRLGASPARVKVSGNLKYDLGDGSETPAMMEIAKSLDDYFALSSCPLIIAGSTCEGEESVILKSFGQLRAIQGMEDVRLLLAPRHPERFDQVGKSNDFPVGMARRSQQSSVSVEAASKAGVILLDSVGELAALYRFASIVFVGGSLVPKGGHNILEPALFGKPVIVGPYMQNFREIARDFLKRDAVIQIQQTTAEDQINELSKFFAELLGNPEKARRLGENARKSIEENSGATATTIAAIAKIMHR